LLVSIREYARSRGISHPAVLKRIKSGKLSTVNGQIDPEVADREWAANRDQAQQRQKPAAAKPDPPAAPRPSAAPAARQAPALPQDGRTFNDARTKREWVRLEREAMALAKEKRKLLDGDEVRQAVGIMIAEVRQKLLQIGPELGMKLALETDAVACREMVDARIFQALAELAEFRIE
jgi:hypothetical protein